MPQATIITVNDREPTPVSHNYTPDSRDASGVWHFVENDGTPAGNRKITVSRTVSASGTVRVRMRYSDPVVVTETINGVERATELRSGTASLEFIFGKHSTLQERKNLVGKVANSLGSGQTLIMGVVENLEGIYG